ncbi:TPA: hypothetical protein PL523_004066 [Cronobacter turicensis]|uniref:hypothetical protein n=1 Tax=Cronobacter turicensis TaxID=413502 RepID=UPI0024C41828|nr:hypothetical protein [Cronobacter turicensis]MDK1233729.1 hypothetical protein [Cronobacter turicensis]HDI3023524.1 hypothetical protein [Cronobacter turicensis]HDI3035663.1 hypothetical protein [Cronobacter turicensis]
MNQKKVQLAHIYRGKCFLGYGIAVDGVLLSQQLNTSVNTEPGAVPSITAVFGLDAETNENPVRIDLSEKHS